MTRDQHDGLDAETVRLMEATSHSGSPRDFLVDCLGCGNPFWCFSYKHPPKTYCTMLCYHRTYWRDHPLHRARHAEAKKRRAA
jgi:hypothetical protein